MSMAYSIINELHTERNVHILVEPGAALAVEPYTGKMTPTPQETTTGKAQMTHI